MRLQYPIALVWLAVLAGLSMHAQSQSTGPIPIESFDVEVLRARDVVIGRVVDYSGKDGYLAKRLATVAVDKILKGAAGSRVTLDTFATTTDLRVWKARGTRLLVIVCPNRSYRNWLIDLDDPDLCLPKADFSLIRVPYELIRFVRMMVRRSPGVATTPAFRMSPPNNAIGAAWKKVYSGRSVSGLYVPTDAALEKWARARVRTKRTADVLRGLPALIYFHSKRNVALVEPCLRSNVYAVEKTAEENNGVEVRRFVLREAALKTLRDWKVAVRSPVLLETVPKYNTVTVITWQGPLTDAGLKKLEKCPKLRTLRFLLYPFTDDDLAEIGRLRGLTSLHLVGAAAVDDAGVRHLASLARLRELDLRGTGITDAGLKELAGFRSLRTLWVDETEVTDQGLAAMTRVRPDIRLYPSHATSIINTFAALGNLEGVRDVLDRTPEARDQQANHGNTPLHEAAKWSRYDVVKLLLGRGAEVDPLNADRATPLQLATGLYHADVPVIRLLLGHGAAVNHADKNGNTPLHDAVNWGANEQILLLLACGANPFAENYDGQTPLSFASRASTTVQAAVARFIAASNEPVQRIRHTDADCPRVAYSLAPGSLEGWSTKGAGRMAGPVQWSTSPSGRAFLGPFDRQAVSLKLTGLPAHKNVHVELALYIIGSWDGNGGHGQGPDILDVQVPGVGTALHSTFFNNAVGDWVGLPLQSFPDPYPQGFHRGLTGAAETGTLGFVHTSQGISFSRDAVYKLQLTFAHEGPGLEIVLTGITSPRQGVTTLEQDKTWGLGGLTVKTD